MIQEYQPEEMFWILIRIYLTESLSATWNVILIYKMHVRQELLERFTLPPKFRQLVSTETCLHHRRHAL